MKEPMEAVVWVRTARGASPDQLYDKLKPFKDQVSEDIKKRE